MGAVGGPGGSADDFGGGVVGLGCGGGCGGPWRGWEKGLCRI